MHFWAWEHCMYNPQKQYKKVEQTKQHKYSPSSYSLTACKQKIIILLEKTVVCLRSSKHINYSTSVCISG